MKVLRRVTSENIYSGVLEKMLNTESVHGGLWWYTLVRNTEEAEAEGSWIWSQSVLQSLWIIFSLFHFIYSFKSISLFLSLGQASQQVFLYLLPLSFLINTPCFFRTIWNSIFWEHVIWLHCAYIISIPLSNTLNSTHVHQSHLKFVTSFFL